MFQSRVKLLRAVLWVQHRDGEGIDALLRAAEAESSPLAWLGGPLVYGEALDLLEAAVRSGDVPVWGTLHGKRGRIDPLDLPADTPLFIEYKMQAGGAAFFCCRRAPGGNVIRSSPVYLPGINYAGDSFLDIEVEEADLYRAFPADGGFVQRPCELPAPLVACAPQAPAPEPHWSMLETMAWIIRRSERAVDLVSEAASRRGSGEADSPILLDAALAECVPVTGWDEDAPQYLYPKATQEIVDACRRGALQASARPGWGRDWQLVPRRAWGKKDGGQWWWADQYRIGQERALDAPPLQESTLAFYLAFDGAELTDLSFPAAQVMAAWREETASPKARRGRPARDLSPEDAAIMGELLRLVEANGGNRQKAIEALQPEKIPENGARTWFRRLERRLGPAAAVRK